MASSTAPKYPIIPALDGIRGIAVLAVVIFHCTLLCGPELVSWGALAARGWAGVEMFFVLSGFLITRILLATKFDKNYWRNFIARRALRIFPAYYLWLCIIWVAFPYVSEQFASSEVRGQVWFYAFYLQNWNMAFQGWPDWGYVAHFWSLAVEEQFYIVWPLLVLIVTRKELGRICILLIVASLLFLVMLKGFGNPGLMGYTSTFSQLYAVCAGCFIGTLDSKFLSIITANFFLRLLGAGVVFSTWFLGFKIFIVAITSYAIVLSLMMSESSVFSRALSNSVLRWFGKYSYGIYLIHYPILGVLFDNFGGSILRSMEISPDATAAIVTLGILLFVSLIAFLQYQVFEKPFLKAKNIFDYKSRSQV